MNIDTSKVDRMEIRLRVDAHEKARDVIQAEIEAAEAPFEARIREIKREMLAATAETRKRLAEHDAAEGIYGEVYQAEEEPEEGYDEGKWPLRCTVSGLILLDGDDVIDKDGRYVLTAVLPNWPQDLPDAADEDEEDEAA